MTRRNTTHRWSAAALALAVAALAGPAASAHHSAVGRFSPDKSVELTGTITALSWRNPHSRLTIAVVGADGDVTSWEVETLGISQLKRSGLEMSSLGVGDTVTFGGPAPATDKTESFLRYLYEVTGSGEEVAVYGERPRAGEPPAALAGTFPVVPGDGSRPELGLFRVWSTAGVVPLFPQDPAAYGLTEEAEARRASYDPLKENPTLGCKPKGVPLIMEQPYPMQIEDHGDTIVLRIEEYDTVRTVHMDAQEPPAGEPASLLGYSTGRRDGGTLEVRTTRLRTKWLNQNGIPLSDDAVVTERFTPTADGAELRYELTLEDPDVFTRPVTVSKTWVYVPTAEVLPYNCSE